MDRSRRLILAGLLAFVTAAVVAVGALGQAPAVGGYQLVSDVRVTRTVSELTYRAVLVNGGEGLSSATATAISLSPATVIVDGTLTFGAVGPSGSVLSTDTFSFRQDRTVPFNWSNIRWSISTQLANHPPTADAGPDQTAVVGATVTLDGSRSSDLDGDRLTYHWALQSRPGDSGATLGSPDSVNPTLPIDRPGSYVIRLIVNDGVVDGAPATVTISTVNSAPVANAGADQTVLVGQPVALSGAGSSDVDGDTLTFAWTIVSRPVGSVAGLTNPASIAPVMTPDRPGTYQVQLVVNDGHTNSLPDIAVLTTGNSAPVANAGPDQSSAVGATVTLDGNASTDVDGDTLTYKWSLLSVPAGSTASLVNPTTVMPTFAVDRPGTYIAQLVVGDGSASSSPDTVAIATQNSRPLANAGPDQSIVAGQLVLLDGTGSSDPDGNTLAYDWSFVSRPLGSSANLAGATSAGPSFVADRSGTYVVQLLVSDAALSSAPDTVTLTTTNLPPMANAGPDQLNAQTGSTITLDGSSSTDPDGPILLYQWSLLSKPAGSAAALNGSATASPTFVADATGEYVAQLIVNDGFVNSAPDTVTIRASAPPVAEFTFTLDSATASAFADSTLLVTFSVARQPGFFGSIAVGLANAPSGISADSVEVAAAVSTGILEIKVANTVAAGNASIDLRAAGAGVTHVASMTLTVRPPEARAQEKIRAAMIAGVLDRPTSLLYRAYAAFGDPRLPQEYQGSGSEDEDTGLFGEIAGFLSAATPVERAQLEPFLLRPVDARGWYAHMTSTSATGSAARSFLAAASSAAVADLPTSCGMNIGATNGWISRGSASHPFRVWAHCSDSTDTAAEAYIALATIAFDEIWRTMTTAGLGSPLADAPANAPINPADGVGDGTTDIYLVFSGQVVRRLSEAFEGIRHAAGWAIPTSASGKSSGFIVLPIATLGANLRLTAIHELFHVLQFAHNASLAAGFGVPGFGGLANAPTAPWWYVEASATWAESHFARALSGGSGGLAVFNSVYGPWFEEGFQKRTSAISLHDPTRDRPYEAFIWPYFMELNASAAVPIQVWTAVEGVASPSGADAVMNGLFPFADKFREFAKTDLNTVLDPGDGLPASKRFVHLDAAFEPADDDLPADKKEYVISDANLQADPIHVAPLAAHYARFLVTSDKIRRIEFDLRQLAGKGLDADAFVKIKDTWEGTPRDLNGKEKLVFCMDDPKDKLDALWLVVSNHNLQTPGLNPVDTVVSVTASEAPCPVKWEGFATFDWRIKVAPNTHTLGSANVTWLNSGTFPGGGGGFAAYKPSGSVAIDVFEANGCVAQVNPRTAIVDDTSGNLVIDYTVKPPLASGDGAAGPVATVTDCNGQHQLMPFAIIFMIGEQALNDAEDTLKGHVVQEDQINIITIDYQYKRAFDKRDQQ